MKFCFSAYNINFSSDFASPGGQQEITPPCQPDVAISAGTVPSSLVSPSINNDYFQISSRDYLLTIPSVARYYVSNGIEIVVEPFPDANPDKVRLFLFGSALGALLYQRGLFPLHGSAVATEKGVVIFVGPQGIGKSTLAAYFQRRGYTLLSDDVCAIVQDQHGVLQVLPAFSQMRLCADAFERLGADFTEARFDVDKYVVPLDQKFNTSQVPLNAICLLSHHDKPDIIHQQVRGFRRIELLLTNLYRPSYLPGFETKGDIMKAAALIAKHAVINEITRPRDPERLDELIDKLESEWQSDITSWKGKDD